MSPEMIGEMMVAFAWLADQAPLRALIVTGSGKAFCAGGDINGFREGAEDDSIDLPAQVRRGAEALHTAIIDLRRIPYPVIAAVNGPAAGAGLLAGARLRHCGSPRARPSSPAPTGGSAPRRTAA